MTTSILTLTAALDLYLLEDRAPSTRDTYRKVLGKALAFFGPNRDADLVSKEDIMRYIRHLREQSSRYANHPSRPTEQGSLSPKTVEKHAKTLAAFFNWLQENGYRGDNPAEKMKLRRYERPAGASKAATPQELQAMLKVAQAKAALGKPLHLAIFLFLCDTGCRAGEAAILTIGDLVLDEMGAWVLGKGDKMRPIFYGEQTDTALRQWISVHPEPDPRAQLFGMTTDSLSQVISRLAQAAGITRPIGAHAIRHRVGQVWAAAKLSEQATQMKLGHDNSLVTIEMYYNTPWEYVVHSSRELSLASIFGLPSEPIIFPLPKPVLRRKNGSVGD